MIKGIREGYKRYDADDNLLETIEDQPLSIAETDTLMQTLCGQYLYDMKLRADADGQKEI